MNYQNPVENKKLQAQVQTTSKQISLVADNIEKVIRGKREVIENVLIALTANGHVLLRDVPGVGKTLLARALARSISANFRRIQFTPDLLPSDISGVNIFNQKKREFEFMPGPVFTNILLADEINRASPKTQSALLEAMEERQVSVDNTIYKLDKLFFVIATKNPIEHDGTYPLPAAQLDRFTMRLGIGYPEKETEVEILKLHTQNVNPLDELKPIVKSEDVLEWQRAANGIYTAPIVDEYIVDLTRATRDEKFGQIGASPRASMLLKKSARAAAMLQGRDFVIPDDIHRAVKPVLAHRIDRGERVGDSIIEEVLEKVPAP